MKPNLLNIIIIISLLTSVCLAQKSNLTQDDLLHIEKKYCIMNPESTSEIIYEYTDRKLTKKSNYSRSYLSNYEKIEYNDYGYEKKRCYYNYNDELIYKTLSFYDHENILLEKRKTNGDNELILITEYDVLGRMIAEKSYRNNDAYDNPYSYYLYEYIEQNLVSKSYYSDHTLRYSEEYIYNPKDQIIRLNYYSKNFLSKSIIYEYEGMQLSREMTYKKSRGLKLISDKKYYREKNRLIQVIENGFTIKQNYYDEGRLIRSENHYLKSFGPERPPGNCDYIVEYKYYKK
ncbi:hypothetical protein [Saccharicrinis aurantiacus]|uniref:hypothetical protein n=1 Tax=Saccharicrinis aurantiacus TaxID=1849719 RepID=UPI00248F5DA0|nr:hypothetical protein [Saccharicrinis aurantiacus]